ncbi:MAG: sialate O-acetylesterase [Pirellulaceae bacterium]|jgi:alpha-galactosidase|nr:sialate O-acetylesterase [Pirellulaceae bacterium]
MKTRQLLLLILFSATPLVALAENPAFAPSKDNGKVKVFILAGQSNMEGRGFPEPLSWQVTQKKYRERYTHFLKDGDYDAFAKKVAETTDAEDRRKTPTYLWSVRRDVWINYLGKHGDLTVGYGAPREGFGPEYNFGHVVGNHYDEQVLLIKTSWGGRALARGFLPPSSMLSDEEYAQQAIEQNAQNEKWNTEEKVKVEAFNARVTEENKTAAKKKRLRQFRPRPIVTAAEYKDQFGKDYRNMVKEVHECLASIGERFPGYRDQGYEIKGFVWFQGWNDQYQDRWLSYEKNMANLIRDVRKEFKAPNVSVVIGQMGHDGKEAPKPDSPREIIMKAQAAVAVDDEFKDNAVCINTGQYWDMEAHAIYTGPGGWQKDVAKWRQFGNDRPYHYLGSPWFFAQVGAAFGDAMLELQK